MKHTIIPLLLTLLLIPLTSAASEASSKQKITIKPNRNDTLVISSRFGSIIVEQWSQPTLEIICDATVRARKQSKAQEILDAIHFKDIRGKRKVGAEATLNTDGKSYGSIDIDIKLRVKAPKGHPMRLNTEFGNIHTDDYDSPLTIRCTYGKLQTGDLRNASINLRFCSGCAVGSAKNIALDNEYSSITIGRADTLRAMDRFGDINIGKLTAAGLGLSYSNFTSTDIIKSLRANASFSNIKIAHLAPYFRLIEVDCTYSKLNIGINRDASFDVTTKNMEYGKCRIKGLHTKVLPPVDDDMDYDSSRQSNTKTQKLRINGGGAGRILFDGGNFSDITIIGREWD